ncbi:hypothetical protein P152DRAFT_441739 [Eremomyces bilateralis CBS 781.70]|uniref:phosphatidylinositol-3,4,5-trisphosphate 3-phosphatase n=1 Tax=Eremomyces bilateralis CBS 781.70 TaxID=1392243 RepID=A0A6G1FUZ3_9PEZI|nr:uncharacterized protein P152DRAFT_441739 [Eremomyces bilateralis CBS 781.70]KAF1809526.1 hypothetical protein P152DRAFT_441739 [Eremomyces bilateralis CBS 781.70]
MASILRQIVASPRARHPEAGLDLCYVTDRIIATSGPSGTYPKRYYRNPLDELVKFLDSKHKDKWAIWEFRAEGTGYPDDEVYGRVWHFPWPDHHPPPFALIPRIVASMRNWLHEDEERVIVVHCKAGKGRSGTSSCAYLIAEEGWTLDDALQRFTARRMRPGFGAGVSIPSQLRCLSYVDRWTNHGKIYIERQIEVLEVHVWGLRDGVKVSVRGFVDEGKVVKTFHTFTREEREIVSGEIQKTSFADLAYEFISGNKKNGKDTPETASISDGRAPTDNTTTSNTSLPQIKSPDPSLKTQPSNAPTTDTTKDGAAAIFRPSEPLILPTSDVNLAVTRHPASTSTLTLVTSVAHVWFNCFFEGSGPERCTNPFSTPLSDTETKQLPDSPLQSPTEPSTPSTQSKPATHKAAKPAGPLTDGVFEIDWDDMDGIKGSSRKGSRALDRVAIVWRAVPYPGTVVTEPGTDEPVRGSVAADWRGGAHPEESPDRPPRDEEVAEEVLGVPSGAAEKKVMEKGAEEKGEDEQQGLGVRKVAGKETGEAAKGVKEVVNKVVGKVGGKEEPLDMSSDDELEMVAARGPEGEDLEVGESNEAEARGGKGREDKS